MTYGDELQITGDGFDGVVVANNLVELDGEPCDVTMATSTSITCRVGYGQAGMAEVAVYVLGMGRAEGVVPDVEYQSSITTISPTQGGLGGRITYISVLFMCSNV